MAKKEEIKDVKEIEAKHNVAEIVLDLGRNDLNALVNKLNELIRATK